MEKHIEDLTKFYESLENNKKKQKQKQKKTKAKQDTKAKSHVINDTYYLQAGDLKYEFERKQYIYNQKFLKEFDIILNKIKKEFVELKYDVLYDLKVYDSAEYEHFESKIIELCEERKVILEQMNEKKQKKEIRLTKYKDDIQGKMILYKEESIDEQKKIYLEIRALKKKINNTINKYSSMLPVHSEGNTYFTIIKDYTPIYGNEINLLY